MCMGVFCVPFILKKKKNTCLERLRATFCCYFKDSPSEKSMAVWFCFQRKKPEVTELAKSFLFLESAAV